MTQEASGLDRIPPHSFEVEKAVLGTCIQFGNGAIAEVADILKPEMFYKESHIKMFRAILSLKDKGVHVDQITVVEELNRTGDLGIVPAYLVAEYASEMATKVNAEYHSKIVEDDWQRRKLLTNLSQAEERIYNRNDPVDSIVEPIREQRVTKVSSSCELVGDAAGPVIDEIERAWRDGVRTGIRSGISVINNATGGYQPGEYYIIAARPSVGKTALGLFEARRNKVPTWFVSAEMTKRLLIHRLLTGATGIPSNRLREGDITPTDYILLQEAEKQLKKLDIYIEDHVKDIEGIQREAYKMVDLYGIKLVVIDYIGLIQPPPGNFNREREVAEISARLKDLSKDLDLPVIAMSQLSRGAELHGGPPKLSDLRDSGSLEQDADVVIFLHREHNYSKTTRIEVAKNRNGPIGHADYRFDGLRGTFALKEEE
jgi:replicative DNA helicase